MSVADRRLHPASLLERTLKSLPRLLLPIGVAMFGSRGGEGFIVLFVGGATLLVLGYRLAELLRFRFGVGPGEIVIESGVFSRNRRVVPFERLQDVTIERSPIARAVGLARVRLETGGGAADEGLLDSLGHAEALELQRELRAARGVVRAPWGEAEQPPLYAMTPGRVLREGLYSPSLVLFGALAALGSQAYEATQSDFGLAERALDWANAAAASASAARIALLALVVVAVGLASGVALAFARNYRFSLTLVARALRVRRGLFTLAEVGVPLARVQALIRRDGPIRRAHGWSALSAQTLGQAGGAAGGALALAPLARADEVAAIERAVGIVPAPDAYTRVSPRFVGRAALRLATLAVPAAVIGATQGWAAPLAAAALLALGTLAAARRWRAHGYALSPTTLHVRRGWLGRVEVALPIAAAQAFALQAGPLQRALGLASVGVDSAGAGRGFAPFVTDLPRGEAEALLDATRAAWRSARATGVSTRAALRP